MSTELHTGPASPSTATSPAPAAPADGKVLTGAMGTASLALTVLAFSAPMGAIAGFVPFMIAYGGTGTTFGLVIVTAVLLLFCAGYVAMIRNVPKPGDFYSFISSGLGRTAGLGAAFLAATSYIVLLAGVYAQLGTALTDTIRSFGGPDTSWILWTAVGVAVISTLGYFNIELSSKILTWAMAIEVAVVMIYNLAVILQGGHEGNSVSAEPFNPSVWADGNIGLMLLFAILIFLGFEATALFRDEVRNPNKTIPRATYVAVISIGSLYILSTYALTVAYGDQTVEVAATDPVTMFGHSIGQYVAPVFTQITMVILVTSVLAALLSIHNIVARYLHNLAYDKALPHGFAAVHPRHASPHRASLLATAVTVLLIAAFVIGGIDGASLYGRLTGLGALGIIMLMALVSLAVIVWFARRGVPASENRFKVFVAPALALTAFAVTVVFALAKFNLLVGGETPTENMWLVALPLSGLAVGLVLARYLSARRPEVFLGLGREGRVVDLNA